MSDDTELGSNLFSEPVPASKPRKAAAKNVSKADTDRTWIVVEENEDIPPTGLPLSVNGEACMVFPGEAVHLQNRYKEVLDHAIISVPQRDSSERVVGSRERHRFPYRLATPAEIEAASNKS